jgi:hypothetical protein
MPGTHDTIIAQIAKGTLGALGFQRKGRTRTWMADHGWWANVVEFQPSQWSKGSYLNVAAHWLWSSSEHLSFDYGGRLVEHIQYVSDEQFKDAASGLVKEAEREALRLSQQFVSLSATAVILLGEERKLTDKGRRSASAEWMAHHAGIAAGLSGLTTEAHDMFSRVIDRFASDSLLVQNSVDMAKLLNNPQGFRDKVISLIVQHRAALRLPAPAAIPL